MRKLSVITLLMALIIGGCQKPQTKADLVLLNSKVYTPNPRCRGGRGYICRERWRDQLLWGAMIRFGLVGDGTEVLDMSESYIYPGFIEGHAHIMGIGANIINVDLMQARSYEEVVRRVQERAAVNARSLACQWSPGMVQLQYAWASA